MPKTLEKKELKKFINENGFFFNTAKLEIGKNVPDAVASKVPEGATYFEGVVSNGELNRNGYIIRPKALIESLGVFMMNPIILLGHETDEPIGRCLTADIRGGYGAEEIFVSGYVFDDLTGERFSRGLLSALSTGHITQEVEFENTETGQVISEEEFRKFNWEEQYYGKWVMAVTKLEWVEFSVVAIGSNRKSLITMKNAIEAFIKGSKFSQSTCREVAENSEDAEEKTEGEGEAEAKAEADTTTTDDSTKADEAVNDAATAPAATEETAVKSGEGDNATTETKEEKQENKISISKADRQKLLESRDLFVSLLEATIAEEEAKAEVKAEDATEEEKQEEKKEEVEAEKPKTEAKAEVEEDVEGNSAKLDCPPEVKLALQTLVDMNTALTKEVSELQALVRKTPQLKGLAIVSQFNSEAKKEDKKPSTGELLVDMLRKNGIKV